jgi:hypothetical protein
MRSNIKASDLSFVEDHSCKLTINAQESLKERLLCQAKERANHDLGPDQLQTKVHRHYYDVLAAFMTDHPRVVIDLILIKLDENLQN